MKVTCIGEMLIDFVCTDTNAGLVKGYNFVKKPGGAPANVAACIGKLGGEPLLVAAVGNDPFGRYLIDEVSHYHVKTQNISVLKSSTSLAFVSLSDDGEREFAFNRGADEKLRLSKVQIEKLLDDSILHLGSATALLGGNLSESYMDIAKEAYKKGNIICFDPNFRIDLWNGNEDNFREKCEAYFAMADVVKVSDDELFLLSQANDIESGCDYFHSKGVKILLVTLGSKGCLVSQGKKQYIVPAYKVTAIDTTGAGDSFIGALLFKMSKHSPNDDFYASQMKEFVAFAEKVSGLVCSKLGAMTALPAMQEINSMEFIVNEAD